MTKSRITRIELQGFRSFGQARQILDLPDSVAVLWGGNSQGKTSFAEALEFLLTGQIARRELVASTRDEFTEALKNAHIAPAHDVVVEACVCCADGQVRKLTRTLVEDYKRGPQRAKHANEGAGVACKHRARSGRALAGDGFRRSACQYGQVAGEGACRDRHR